MLHALVSSVWARSAARPFATTHRHLPLHTVRPQSSLRAQRRAFSQRGDSSGGAPPPQKGGTRSEAPMTRAEVDAISQGAREQERWTNILMPEKNWGITSPATWTMLVAICVLAY